MLQSYFVNMKMTRSDSVVTGFLLLLRCFLLTISLTSDVHGHTLRSRDDAVPSQIIRHRKLLVPSKGSRLIDGQYIIVLNKDVKSVEAKVEEVLGTSQSSSSSVYSKSVNSDIAEVNSFNSSISGFTITNVSQDCLQILLEDKDVKWIEQDQIITVNAIQSNAPWHLDRLDDSTSERIDYSTSKVRQYAYSRTGAGVTVYLLDSGIRMSHTEFAGGRAQCAYDVFNSNCQDNYGHGTHVAGIVGGTIYGAAKGVNLMAIKIISDSGEGAWSTLIAGIDYVANQKKKNPAMRIIINISMGGGFYQTVNDAVQAAVDAGIVVVVAAANDNGNACQVSPASATSAITVGSTSSWDRKSSFSNYGPCVDIFAPGSSIISAGILSDTAITEKSGTSMAAPLVAGVAALYMEQYPSSKPSDVVKALKDASYKGGVLEATSPNEIVSTIFLFPTPAPTRSPTAAPVTPPRKCTGLMGSCTSHGSCCSGRCFRLVRLCSI